MPSPQSRVMVCLDLAVRPTGKVKYLLCCVFSCKGAIQNKSVCLVYHEPKHDAGTATRHYRAFWQRRCRAAHRAAARRFGAQPPLAAALGAEIRRSVA